MAKSLLPKGSSVFHENAAWKVVSVNPRSAKCRIKLPGEEGAPPKLKWVHATALAKSTAAAPSLNHPFKAPARSKNALSLLHELSQKFAASLASMGSSSGVRATAAA